MHLIETQQREKNDYGPNTNFACRTDVGDLSWYGDRRRAKFGPGFFGNCPYHQQRDDFQTVVGKKNKPHGGPLTNAWNLPYQRNKNEGSDHLRERWEVPGSKAEQAS